MMRSTGGGPAKSTRAWLQEQTARTIVMIDPSRADELLQTLDPANRGAILQALLSYYEGRKLLDRAIEQFNRIATEDEAPYGAAARIMANLKPEQSGELAAIFSVCLSSYKANAPHEFQPADPFAKLVITYWQKVPKQLARDAVDEILQQAQDDKVNKDFSMSFGDSGQSAGSLLEYRLVQFMPMLQEFEPSRANEFREKHPSVAGLANSYAASAPSGSAAASDNQATSGAGLRVNGDSGNIFMNMAEWPMAEKIAAKADAGHGDEAITEAASIRNPDLKIQAYEHIARATLKKDTTVAASALKKMLTAIDDAKLGRQPEYYASAASVFVLMGDPASAKDAIEKGLGSAAQLYKQDTDSDDPNTAFAAFWPSTNAYRVLLRQARRISEAWAVTLLKEIDNPEIRFAAEVAIAGSALNVPESRETIITSKRKGFKMSLGAESPEGSQN
ncbi:MAG TPA: hypothetical protein VJW20_06765 [Candidatus Angelobacter sp.]|nr:hypothetical protein [Candidatus Angelobacter sp.]